MNEVATFQQQGLKLEARLQNVRKQIEEATAQLDRQIASGQDARRTAGELAELRTVEAALRNAVEANETKLREAQVYDGGPEGKARRKQAEELEKQCRADDTAVAEAINSLYAVAATALANAGQLQKLGGHHDTTMTQAAWRRADELMRDKSLLENTARMNTPEARERARRLDEQAREQRAKNLEAAQKAARARGVQIPLRQTADG